MLCCVVAGLSSAAHLDTALLFTHGYQGFGASLTSISLPFAIEAFFDSKYYGVDILLAMGCGYTARKIGFWAAEKTTKLVTSIDTTFNANSYVI